MTLVMRPLGILPARTARSDPGQSRDAQRLTQLWQKLSESASNTGRLTDARLSLERTYSDSCLPNWDGYGAEAVPREAYDRARSLLESLPSAIPLPEIGVEPDGGLTFEWFFGPNGSFSIIIGSHCQLTYAGIFGAARAHGVEHFVDEIPQVIIANLQRAAREHR